MAAELATLAGLTESGQLAQLALVCDECIRVIEAVGERLDKALNDALSDESVVRA